MGKVQEIHHNGVNLSTQRDFVTKFKSGLKETFFPDDPFRQIMEEEKTSRRLIKGVQYFVPIFEWLPTYTLRLFFSDLIAGLTIASLAIPQGISYAKLANLPPLVGLCKSLSFS
jgi:sulfate transporter 3